MSAKSNPNAAALNEDHSGEMTKHPTFSLILLTNLCQGVTINKIVMLDAFKRFIL